MFITVNSNSLGTMAKLPHTDSADYRILASTETLLCLSLAVVNFHSIKNKQAELQAFQVAYSITFIIGTKSHLDGSVY